MTAKIWYGIILIFSVGLAAAAATEKSVYGEPAAMCALAFGEVLIIYGGVCMKRMRTAFDNDKKLKNILGDIYIKSESQRRLAEGIRLGRKELSRIRHDIANHMEAMTGLAESSGNAEAVSIIENIRQRLSDKRGFKYCDNTIFDMAIEQKLAELGDRGLTTEADIRLKGIADIECEELCLIFWMLTDHMADSAYAGDKIHITMDIRDITDDYIILRFKLERMSGQGALSASASRPKSRELPLIKNILRRMNGSMAMTEKDGKITEVVLLEVKTCDD